MDESQAQPEPSPEWLEKALDIVADSEKEIGCFLSSSSVARLVEWGGVLRGEIVKRVAQALEAERASAEKERDDAIEASERALSIELDLRYAAEAEVAEITRQREDALATVRVRDVTIAVQLREVGLMDETIQEQAVALRESSALAEKMREAENLLRAARERLAEDPHCPVCLGRLTAVGQMRALISEGKRWVVFECKCGKWESPIPHDTYVNLDSDCALPSAPEK